MRQESKVRDMFLPSPPSATRLTLVYSSLPDPLFLLFLALFFVSPFITVLEDLMYHPFFLWLFLWGFSCLFAGSCGYMLWVPYLSAARRFVMFVLGLVMAMVSFQMDISSIWSWIWISFVSGFLSGGIAWTLYIFFIVPLSKDKYL